MVGIVRSGGYGESDVCAALAFPRESRNLNVCSLAADVFIFMWSHCG